MIFNCIIIDDEAHAIEGLKRYIEKTPKLKVLKTYTDPVTALSEIRRLDNIDIIFMDVDMPEISGIDLSREIRNRTKKLVFCTAHTKYGYEAFEVKADAYLLKPYTLAKFISTIDDILAVGESLKEEKEAGETEDYFFVKSKEDNLKLIKVFYNDIIAVESKLNYVMIHTTKKALLTYMSLSEISGKFRDLKGFVQFQRSFIIAEKHIDSIAGNTIYMNGDLQLTVGDYYKKDFNEFLNSKLLKAKRKA